MSFPSLTLLDSFKRGNEKPLSNGGKWTKFPSCDGIASVEGISPEIKEEACTSQVNEGSGETSAYWNPAEFLNGAGAFSTHDLAPVFNNERIRFFFRLKKVSIKEFSGYFLELQKDTETAEKYKLRIKKFTKSAASELLREATIVNGADGDRYGVTFEGKKLQMWHKHLAGAWEEVGAVVEDSTFSKGWVGLGMRGTPGRAAAQNFEAAAIPEPPFPAVTTLDDLNRNEEPLSNGGKWAVLPWASNPLGPKTGKDNEGEGWTADIESGESGEEIVANGITSGAYWTPASFTAPVAISFKNWHQYGNWVGGVEDPMWVSVWACLDVASYSGYRLKVEGSEKAAEEGSSEDGQKNQVLTLEKVTAGAASALATATVETGLGEVDSSHFMSRFGLTVESGKLRAWYKPETTNESFVEGEWTVACEASDSTYTSGRIGIEANSNGFPTVFRLETSEGEEGGESTKLAASTKVEFGSSAKILFAEEKFDGKSAVAFGTKAQIRHETEAEEEAHAARGVAETIEVPHMKWPIRMNADASHIEFVEQDTPAEIAQCVGLVFTARPGDFADEPELGLDEPAFREEGIGEDELEAAANRWEPRAALTFTSDDLIDAAQTVGIEVESNT